MLLEHWPSYVPSSKLLARITSLPANYTLIAEEEARAAGTLDHLFAPVRLRLRACQERLKHFGLKVVGVYEEGEREAEG